MRDQLQEALRAWVESKTSDAEARANTPRRFINALDEMTGGYKLSEQDLFARSFDGGDYDQMVVLRNMPFSSLCEHHLLPFRGTASIGYLPNPKVVGLSKMARLVEGYASRLQMQERFTQELATAMDTNLKPLGVGVVVKAAHLCMELRGARTSGETVTSALLGAFREPDVRAEFLALVG